MATNQRQHHRSADHPDTTPPRRPACRDSRLVLHPGRYLELDDAHAEAAVAALADLLAAYVDGPEEEAA
ncbi:MAG: hypothetical protein ACYCTL_01745 [Acidimicrobiales bacterium]